MLLGMALTGEVKSCLPLLVRSGLGRLVPGRRPLCDVEDSVGITHFHSPIGQKLVRLSRGINWHTTDQAYFYQIAKVSRQATSAFAVKSCEFLQLCDIFIHTQGAQVIDGIALDVLVLGSLEGGRP